MKMGSALDWSSVGVAEFSPLSLYYTHWLLNLIVLNPSNRYNSPFSAARTTIHNISGKNMSILIFTVEFISFYYDNMNIFDIPIHTTVTQFVWVTCDIDGSKMHILA